MQAPGLDDLAELFAAAGEDATSLPQTVPTELSPNPTGLSSRSNLRADTFRHAPVLQQNPETGYYFFYFFVLLAV
jgi:hypothetical protein